MPDSSKSVVILCGPNGAGKSTAARDLLHGVLKVDQFVNADTIATGLAGFAPEAAAFQARKIMADRLHALAARGEDFAFETTLAGRSLAVWLQDDLNPRGYATHLVYLWLPSPELAVARVGARVRMGGHSIPDATIRRRYDRSIQNFVALYRGLVSDWRVYNNGTSEGPRLVAKGSGTRDPVVLRSEDWRRIHER
ncbi:MAG: AAA family ATPase [Phycisphaerae bacterium]